MSAPYACSNVIKDLKNKHNCLGLLLLYQSIILTDSVGSPGTNPITRRFALNGHNDLVNGSRLCKYFPKSLTRPVATMVTVISGSRAPLSSTHCPPEVASPIHPWPRCCDVGTHGARMRVRGPAAGDLLARVHSAEWAADWMEICESRRLS